MRNRLVMTPHLGRLSTDRFLRYLTERLPGGVGMVVTPAGHLVYGASTYPALQPPTDPVVAAQAAARLAQQAELARAHDVVLIGQIHHPGAERSWEDFEPSVAPSPVRGDGISQWPHALTAAEIGAVVANYGRNAEAIRDAGLHGVEVHAAHGYLVNRFLSPAYNQRRDGYGGAPQACWRLLEEILVEVRRVIGADGVLGVRLPAYEEVDGGLTAADVAAGAARLAGLLDYVNVSFGNHDGIAHGRPVTAYTTPWLSERPDLLPACAEIRGRTGLPVIVTGGFVTAGQVDGALASGSADLVGVARALIADPRFAQQVLGGQGTDVVTCVGCNECVLVPFSCVVNPAAGREADLPSPAAPLPATSLPTTARRARRVVVVGGGVAGLTAGLGLARRGDNVILAEAAGELGGVLAALVKDPVRGRWTGLLHRLVAAAGDDVDVRRDCRPDATTIAAWEPELVVLATGGRPADDGDPADTPSADGTVDVLTSLAVLHGARPVRPGPVLVAAGREPHLDPLLTARLLAAAGHEVVLVAEAVVPGAGIEPRTHIALMRLLFAAGVRVCTPYRLRATERGRVGLVHLFGGPDLDLPAGTVVRAEGQRGAAVVTSELAPELAALGLDHVVIGDALAPRRLTHAVLEGARVAALR